MRLIEIADIFLGRVPPKPRAGDEFVEHQVLALRDVTARIAPRGTLDWVPVAPTSEVVRHAASGDIVITARGRLRAALVEPEHEGVLVGANLILLRLKIDFPTSLMLAYLRHPETERLLLEDAVGTVTQGVSVESLRHLQINIPAPHLCADAAELVELVDLFHDELIESARLLKQGLAEWVFQRLGPEDDR